MRSLLLLSLMMTPAMAALASEVECTLWFDATWSADTHPQNFPGGAHFSPLIGITHDATARLWRSGTNASPGIKDMAERGANSALSGEIQAVINAGGGFEQINGAGPDSPDLIQVDFMMSTDYPLLTFVTMIAPSPDWFVGISGVSLFDNGSWNDIHLSLQPWDAGTDSGLTYISPNQATAPPEPITLITAGDVGNGMPLGTATVSCDGLFLGSFENQ